MHWVVIVPLLKIRLMASFSGNIKVMTGTRLVGPYFLFSSETRRYLTGLNASDEKWQLSANSSFLNNCRMLATHRLSCWRIATVVRSANVKWIALYIANMLLLIASAVCRRSLNFYNFFLPNHANRNRCKKSITESEFEPFEWDFFRSVFSSLWNNSKALRWFRTHLQLHCFDCCCFIVMVNVWSQHTTQKFVCCMRNTDFYRKCLLETVGVLSWFIFPIWPICNSLSGLTFPALFCMARLYIRAINR